MRGAGEGTQDPISGAARWGKMEGNGQRVPPQSRWQRAGAFPGSTAVPARSFLRRERPEPPSGAPAIFRAGADRLKRYLKKSYA